jgi:hypothetical protein
LPSIYVFAFLHENPVKRNVKARKGKNQKCFVFKCSRKRTADTFEWMGEKDSLYRFPLSTIR